MKNCISVFLSMMSFIGVAYGQNSVPSFYRDYDPISINVETNTKPRKSFNLFRVAGDGRTYLSLSYLQHRWEDPLDNTGSWYYSRPMKIGMISLGFGGVAPIAGPLGISFEGSIGIGSGNGLSKHQVLLDASIALMPVFELNFGRGTFIDFLAGIKGSLQGTDEFKYGNGNGKQHGNTPASLSWVYGIELGMEPLSIRVTYEPAIKGRLVDDLFLYEGVSRSDQRNLPMPAVG